MTLDINRLIFYTLRVGVLVSVLLAILGLTAWAIGGFANLEAISGTNIYATTISGFAGNPSGLIYLAVAVLIATPILRVALSSLHFAYEGDRKYVLITVTVLAMLLFALISGSVV